MSIANTFIAGPPEVLPDPRLVPAPYRRPGKPTPYSPELIERFCEFIIEGMIVGVAFQQTGMPSRSTIYEWLARYRPPGTRSRRSQRCPATHRSK
jgi:Bacteriophage Sf6, terminase small subunit-like